MYLTPEEERILDGEQGEGLQLAYQLLVDVGDFFDAEKLIPISSAHVSGVSYLTGGDGLLTQLSVFVEKNCQVSVPTTLNPSGMDRLSWQLMYIPPEFAKKQEQILKYYEQLGVLTTCSCTPYDFGHLPELGQHVAWAESSAVTFANTFFGARTNREDALTALSAAIAGKTAYYGLHIEENRIPNVKVILDCTLKNTADFGFLGHVVGEHFKKTSFPFGPIPVFQKLKPVPRPHQLKALGAALASFSTSLYHVEGVTPEQHLISRAKPDETLKVTSEDLKHARDEFRPPSDELPNLVVIGCPNANWEEIREVALSVKGKKLKKGKEFWIFASRAQKAIADASGLTDTLTAAGIKLFTDTCPEVTPYDKTRFPTILTNSLKAAHYIPAAALNGIPTYVLPLKEIVEVMFE